MVELLSHIVAAQTTKAASFVRVAWNDPVLIKPVLDMGPDGLIAPMVLTAKEAKAFVDACLYPPRGVRGFGPRLARQYGALSTSEYISAAKDRMLRIIQIEHITAVENLHDILKVAGVDLIIVGPNDLSASMGHLGDTRNAEMLPVYDRIAQIAKRCGMPFGVSLGPDDERSIQQWLRRGARVISCGDDVSFIAKGAQTTLAKIKDWARAQVP